MNYLTSQIYSESVQCVWSLFLKTIFRNAESPPIANMHLISVFNVWTLPLPFSSMRGHGISWAALFVQKSSVLGTFRSLLRRRRLIGMYTWLSGLIRSTSNALRYDKFATMYACRDEPNFRMCPNPSCGNGQVHAMGHDEPILTCNACGSKACFTHEVFWHTGQTCKEFEATRVDKRAQEAASLQLLAKTTKICPNEKCGIHIEKEGGCDHFTCECSIGVKEFKWYHWRYNRSCLSFWILLGMPQLLCHYQRYG